MIDRSLAHSGTESTPVSRVERGRQLFEEHATDFVYEDGAWLIASDTVAGRVYEVRLNGRESCECSGYHFRGVACKHLIAATLADSKSSPCSCCGHRVLNRFLSEVAEEDELLGWFIGDLLCADCVRAGYWA